VKSSAPPPEPVPTRFPRLPAEPGPDDPTSLTRTTMSIPVIRPPVAVRRPDDGDDAPSLQPHPVRPAATAATSIFTTPVSSAKAPTGPVPTTTAAMPRPVAPKPMSAVAAAGIDPSERAAAYRSAITVTLTGTRTASVGRTTSSDWASPGAPLAGPLLGEQEPFESRGSAPAPAVEPEPEPGDDRAAGPRPRPPSSGWANDLAPDPSRPASTIVPQRRRGSSKVKKRKPQEAEQAPRVLLDPEPAWAPTEPPDLPAGRSRLLSAVVFWAPALILLVLAGAVVWVVR